MVKMLTVLVSTISNSQVFLLKKCEYSYFFSKNISIYAVFNGQGFNNTLTNDIISFEQLGPEWQTVEILMRQFFISHLILLAMVFVFVGLKMLIRIPNSLTS